MNIVHLTTHDKGGAGVAAYRVHESMLENNFNSEYISLYKLTSKVDVRAVKRNSKVSNFAFKVRYKVNSYFLKKVDKNYYYFDKGVYVINHYRELLSLFDSKPDVIIFYWISMFINPKVIRELSDNTNIQLYWYFTDMAPMTGGCHFSWGCKEYKHECGKCPALYSNNKSDLSNRTMKQKIKYLAGSDISLISPNSYLSKQIDISSVFKNHVKHQIPFGVNKEFFSIQDKTKVRDIYNIPNSSKVIFFGATDTNEKRKGAQYLVEALNLLYSKNSEDSIIVCVAGKANSVVNQIKFDVRVFGYVDYSTLRDLYCCADVVVSPSIEDSGPLMICEVMMTATPVVAFDIGLAQDLIDDRTGYKAKNRDFIDLSYGISKVLSKSREDYKNMSKECRSKAMSVCNQGDAIKMLISLIQRKDN